MNAEHPTTRRWASRIGSWLIRSFLVAFVGFILLGMTGGIAVVEIPYHLVIGWALHAARTLPHLLTQWTAVLLPAGCAVIAAYMAHRFIRWWIRSMSSEICWRPVHTAISMALPLLTSSAAIAMSGITHQFAWLMSESWLTDRGRKSELTEAVSNIRQVMFALIEYETNHGKYPDSLEDITSEMIQMDRVLWLQPTRNKSREPLVFLKAGSEGPLRPSVPVIISPVIASEGRIAVGYADGSVRSEIASEFLDRLLNE